MDNGHVPSQPPLAASHLDAMVDMAVESWRLARLFTRVLHKIDVTDQQRYSGQIRYYLTSLEKNLASAGLRLVDLEGQTFDAGMAVKVANLGDFDPDEPLFVEQMLEPVVMGNDGLVRVGKIIVRRGQECGTTSV